MMKAVIQKRSKTQGMTIVELMIALLLGLFLVASVVSIYVATKKSYNEVEMVSRLSENGHFALQMMTSTLRRAGYFGEVWPGNVTRSNLLDDLTSDCSGAASVYDLENFLFAVRSDTNGDALGCIDDAVPNTDILFIKSVAPRPLVDSDNNGVIDSPESLQAGTPYVMANNIIGVLFDGADTPPSITAGGDIPNGDAWEYRFEAYYLRDGDVPELSRKILGWDGTNMQIDTEDLVPGVENIRYLFGEDTNSDGEIDMYYNLSSVTDWSNVDSVELYLLVRSAIEDPDYTDAKTYSLGDVTLIPGGNFYRMILHSSVLIRNNKIMIRGGS